MCEIIAINRGEIELSSPEKFKNYFGFLPEREVGYNKLILDCCLCQCDLPKTFKKINIEYWFDNIDTYFVGELKSLNKDYGISN